MRRRPLDYNAAMARRPSFLFVMADQLVPFLTGAYGHPVVQTPHLDRLAADGVLFEAAYTPAPLCAPARASVATARYASRLGVYDNASAFGSEELTWAHHLGAAGYDCVASGKLHYVGPDQCHGFARRLTGDIYPDDYRWLQNRDPDRAGDPDIQGGHALQYTGEAIRVGEWRSNLSYDEEVGFRALEYLRAKGLERRSRPPEEITPFFLMASFHHPHDPFWPPQELWDLYEGAPIDLPDIHPDQAAACSILDRWLNQWHQTDRFQVQEPASLRRVRRAYYALVSYVDRKLGELMDALEQHGLADDTVVVFTSDHGDMLGEKGMVQKRTFYEWSTRVPLVVRFPDRRAAGRRVAAPVSLVDLLPTFLDIAGVPDPVPHEGRSLLPLMRGEASTSWDVFAESHAEGIYGACFMLRTERHKLVHIHHEGGEEAQLFDLHADPTERRDLAREPEHAPLLAELRARLLDRFDPPAVQREIHRSLRVRGILKRWSEQTGTSWSYAPRFDPRRRTWEQYLP